ncbi:MAG: glycosyltransferase [bacterium]
MSQLREVGIPAQPLDRFLPLLGEAVVGEANRAVDEARDAMEGRVFWHVNSTARGGGVAEILQALLPYARGAGIDARWLVIGGKSEFFRITKRLHNALHGSTGDGSALGERERAVYEDVIRANADELLQSIRPGDVLVLHDPQTAGLAPYLIGAGAIVVWRSHIGKEQPNEEVERGWAFLAPYLDSVAATVFSREAYIPDCCDRERAVVIPPSIDPFTPKNQDLEEANVRAILARSGLVGDKGGGHGPGGDAPSFVRQNGSSGNVGRQADVIGRGKAPDWEAPLVVQVSRWDRLKDPVGVLKGFARLDGNLPEDARLLLAGPGGNSVADDPESSDIFEKLTQAWQDLPSADRNRVSIASLPMADLEENAAIVNALQRHAAVVVQKSLDEGFGLTVTEAMWKGRPIVATAVGGIQDQITHDVHGLLVQDPENLGEFGDSLIRVLNDRPLAKRLGEEARERVREEYLCVRHLVQYAKLLTRLDASSLKGWCTIEPVLHRSGEGCPIGSSGTSL